MSTRSLIAIQNEDKTYSAIYCHLDGYDCENGVGPTLRENYNSQEKANEVISLGDISYIKEQEICAYHRDRNEPWYRVKPTKVNNLEELHKAAQNCDAQYIYVFLNGEWITSNV